MRVDSRVITPMNARRSMLLAKPATVQLTSLASHADSLVTIRLNALSKLLAILANPVTAHLISPASRADSLVTICLNALRKLPVVELLP